MSNVLIGIIATTLVVGLALANSIFLGSNFRSTSGTSQAARVVNEVSQISSAAMMYYNDRNEDVAGGANGVAVLVASRYLKEIPQNSVTGGRPYRIAQASDIAAGTGAPLIVIAPIGTNVAICKAVETQMGGSPALILTVAGQAAFTTAYNTGVLRTVGCFRTSAAIGGVILANEYAIYAKV